MLGMLDPSAPYAGRCGKTSTLTGAWVDPGQGYVGVEWELLPPCSHNSVALLGRGPSLLEERMINSSLEL